tara:strand:+ start:420 stop:611 length:192 start_codon:yes stop_codon:yes gene_type:complete
MFLTFKMRKFLPFLLFSSATFYSTLSTLPVAAMSCDSHGSNAEVACANGDSSCEKKILDDQIN